MGSIEYTLAMIKPDAVDRADRIEKDITEEGFSILQKRNHILTKEEAENFYAEHKGKPFFEGLVDYMTSGAIVAMILSKENAVSDWRRFLGPTKVSTARNEAPGSLRAKYGDKTNDSHNGTHGSDSEASAQREIKFFFPELQGLAELCKIRPENPIIWLADWLLVNNPNNKKMK